MLRGSLGLKGRDIVVVTPYRGALESIQSALAASSLPPECKNVEVNTTDSFRGREGSIVVFVLVVNASTGPPFVADAHRVCVGLTRHKAALVVVGDINTVSKGKAKVQPGQKAEGDRG